MAYYKRCSQREAAEHFGVHRNTIANWIKNGSIRTIKKQKGISVLVPIIPSDAPLKVMYNAVKLGKQYSAYWGIICRCDETARFCMSILSKIHKILGYVTLDLPDECKKYFLDSDVNYELFMLYMNQENISPSLSISNISELNAYIDKVRRFLSKEKSQQQLFKFILSEISQEHSISLYTIPRETGQLFKLSEEQLRAIIANKITSISSKGKGGLQLDYETLRKVVSLMNIQKHRRLINYCKDWLYIHNMKDRISLNITVCVSHIIWKKVESGHVFDIKRATAQAVGKLFEVMRKKWSLNEDYFNNTINYWTTCTDVVIRAVEDYLFCCPKVRACRLMNITSKEYERTLSTIRYKAIISTTTIPPTQPQTGTDDNGKPVLIYTPDFNFDEK